MEQNLPNDILVEKALLGAMLISSEAATNCLGSLSEEDFYEKNVANRCVFEAMKRLAENKTNIDAVTVNDMLNLMQKNDIVGGVEFLIELSNSAIGLTSIEHYIKILKDCTVLRTLLLKMQDIIVQYNEGIDGTISDFVAKSGDDIATIVEKRRVAEFIGLNEYVNRLSTELSRPACDGVIGVSTGFNQLNRYSNGFQEGDMIVLAARPSVGKTALALNFALHAARTTNKTVAFFSLEMSGDLLTKRLLAIESGVELNKITTRFLNKQERLAIQKASSRLSEYKFFIDDTPSIKINDLISKAKKLQTNHNDLAMVLIDYIGLITSSSKPKGDYNRQIEVSEFSRKVKDLARTLKVPVIVLCQLSRGVDRRESKEPVLSDLRESGAIEQDADLVMLLSPYNKKAKKINSANENNTEEKNNVSEDSVTLIRLNLAKNRNGQTGEVPLLFEKKFSKFSEIAPETIAKYEELGHSGFKNGNHDLDGE